MSADNFLVARENMKLPNLHTEAEPQKIDLMSDYWTPEKIGETKRVFYMKIEITQVRDERTDELIDLPCAFFMEQDSEGNLNQIRNGSSRLVSTIDKYNLEAWTALEIEYKGKVKNKTNSNFSDYWRVTPLRVKS